MHSSSDTIHNYSVLQTARVALCGTNGCNWRRGVSISDWDPHVGKGNCRVLGRDGEKAGKDGGVGRGVGWGLATSAGRAGAEGGQESSGLTESP